jgi:hypothetical protein
MRLSRLPTQQLLACLLIAAAGLVPVFHKNRPFWGLSGGQFGDAPPRVHTVDLDSPAAAAGLKTGDQVLAVNGAAVDYTGLMAVLDALGPGETARLRINRGDVAREVTVTGVEAPVAMIYYPTRWHPIAGAVGLGLAFLLFATGTLRPAPWWRPAIVGTAGLGLAVLFFAAILANNIFLHWTVRHYHNLNWGAKWHFHQSWVGLAASLALAALAAWELRGTLREAAAAKNLPPDLSSPRSQ